MKPIAVTMGCPVGIGPEIILRFFEDLENTTEFPPVVLGDFAVLSRTAEQLQSQAEPVPWHPGNEIRPGTVPVMALSQLKAKKLLWGKPTRETSVAMAGYIRAAVEHTQRGDFAAMVTCPISKKSAEQCRNPFPRPYQDVGPSDGDRSLPHDAGRLSLTGGPRNHSRTPGKDR